MSVVGEVLPSTRGPRFLVLFLYFGDPPRGKGLLKTWQALKPQEDTVRVTSYLEAQGTINPYTAVAHFQRDLFLPELNANAIATITAAAKDATPNERLFIVPFYGAIARVGVSDTAYPLRKPGFELDIMGRWNAVCHFPCA